MVAALPVTGVAPTIVQEYVGLTIPVVTAVNVTVLGVKLVASVFTKLVNPEISTTCDEGATGVAAN